jgi:hypothetical protein
MEKKKIDRIIEAVRNYITLKEEGMVANAPGSQGGFSSVSPDQGPVAGRSPKMFFLVRKFAKTYAKGGPGSRKKWLDYLKK